MAQKILILFFILVFSVHVAWAEKVSVSIQQGWNLINSPLQLDNAGIDSLVAEHTDSISSLWKWQGMDWAVRLFKGNSTSYAQEKGFELISELGAGEGCWLHADNPFTLDLLGEYSENATITVAPGWNLIGLKSGEPLSLQDCIEPVSSQIHCVWAWEQNVWSVFLADGTESTQEYVEGKGFKHLTQLKPEQGFWVNADAGLTWNPGQGQAMTEIQVVDAGNPDHFLPLPGVILTCNGLELGQTDAFGFFKTTESIEELNLSKTGYADLTLQASPNNRQAVFMHPKDAAGEELLTQSPGQGAEQVFIQKTKTELYSYRNPFFYPTTIKTGFGLPTPKVISDANLRATIVVSKMQLDKDITVGLQPYTDLEALPDDFSFGASQIDVLPIAGADIDILDAGGQVINPEESTFQGNVRPVCHTFVQDAATIETIQDQLNEGQGYVYVLYKHTDEWHLGGKASFRTLNGKPRCVPEEDVYMTGLYPFVFVFSQSGLLSGSVTAEGHAVEGALVVPGDRDDAVYTDTDGGFQGSFPACTQTISLEVLKPGYYIEQVNTPPQDFSGQIVLNAFPESTLHGTLQTPAVRFRILDFRLLRQRIRAVYLG